MDLESPKRVTGIITQGAKDFGSVQFVTAFKVSYSNDGQSWTTVKDETAKTDMVLVSKLLKKALLRVVDSIACILGTYSGNITPGTVYLH